MKVVIGYPPLESGKGIPYLGQNRQFQWGHNPWNAYPMVPAYAAALLKKAGHQVSWLDGIAGGQSFQQWLDDLKKANPDLLMIETKTPVVKSHWQIIERLKKQLKLTIVLVGDHVTALPEESFENSKVDYVLTGGDYDFALLNLVNHLENGQKLAPGVYYRGKGKIVNTGKFQLKRDLDQLPFIDRNLTQWPLYSHKNSNYSRTPGTYTMFGRDCWWGKCSFCSWTTLFPGQKYRCMTPKRALDEIGHVLDQYPVREIMDDSGTFPVGDWLREFCQGMIDRKYHQKIKIGCNMRFNTGLKKKDYQLMGKAGFRFLLYGLESANQKTLNKINKNSSVKQIRPVLKMAKQAGLWPHVTAMVGYPWETKKDAQKTLDLARDLFKKGLVDTLQATIVIPYPGTLLFKECQKSNWLKTEDWDRYDMREPVMKIPMSDEQLTGLVKGFFSSFWSPEFVARKIWQGLTSYDHFKYYFWMGMKYFSKRKDFGSP
jgi:radical SAM superfamily enzyme YgiQ (UPF0313 family)